MSFEVLPECFDWVVVGTVGRQIDGFEMMPVESFGFVPTGVVEDEVNVFFSCAHFLGHGVEKCLECFGVVVRHDEAYELPVLGIDCSNDVLSNVSAEVTLSGATPSFDPALAWGPYKKVCLTSPKL